MSLLPGFRSLCVCGLSFRSSGAVDNLWLLSCGPLHRETDNMVARIEKVRESASNGEKASKMEVGLFQNLLMEMTAHKLCCILFARCKAPGPIYTRGKWEGDYTGCESQESGLVGNQVRTHLPHLCKVIFEEMLLIHSRQAL